MIDPVGVTGLTIAIIDDLLKLGERTAEYISDVRAFKEDSKRFCNDIFNENHKTKILRQLLFTPSSTYEGQTLFRQFDDDAQEQIKVSLGRLVNVLQEAYNILQGRYGSRIGSDLIQNWASESMLGGIDVSISSSDQRKTTTSKQTSTLQMIKWSFRDKKRVETIIYDFTRLNGGIHEYIKLICLGSSIGVGLRHLKYLQDDENSIGLGFDVDAKLKLSVQSESGTPPSLELPRTWAPETLDLPVLERFTIFQYGRKSFFVESRPYESAVLSPPGIEPLAAHRFDTLTQLLQQPKEQVFRIPRCIGWKYVQRRNSVAFIFESPTPQCRRLVSLNQLLRSDHEKPSLNSKFSLAHGLAKGVAQLHLVRWLHENFCSDNILFFPYEDGDATTAMPKNPVQYHEPWILGFESSRPEGELSYGPTELYPERDVYRHPDRQGQVRMQFQKLHDIYGLGVVLLEIGLWSPAVSLQSQGFTTARNAQVIKEQLIKQADRRLASHLGSRYRDLVLKCLKGDFGVTNDTKDDLKLQQAFRTQVVDVLKVAAESV